jgi:hypothetical protein
VTVSRSLVLGTVYVTDKDGARIEEAAELTTPGVSGDGSLEESTLKLRELVRRKDEDNLGFLFLRHRLHFQELRVHCLFVDMDVLELSRLRIDDLQEVMASHVVDVTDGKAEIGSETTPVLAPDVDFAALSLFVPVPDGAHSHFQVVESISQRDVLTRTGFGGLGLKGEKVGAKFGSHETSLSE